MFIKYSFSSSSCTYTYCVTIVLPMMCKSSVMVEHVVHERFSTKTSVTQELMRSHLRYQAILLEWSLNRAFYINKKHFSTNHHIPPDEKANNRNKKNPLWETYGGNTVQQTRNEGHVLCVQYRH